MFATERQRAECCVALMDQSFLKGLWTPEGPTSRAIDLLESDGSGLSRGERVLLLITWAIWSESGNLRFGEVMDLDEDKMKAVGSLLIAMAAGSQEIDRWLDVWAQPTSR